ncbi:MAG TPA: sulfurtransferase complex subunit TusC [Pseudomonadales bacterium]|nr:sulfurtransferase complex subunit TusC [Pseudomonadales bacterium]
MKKLMFVQTHAPHGSLFGQEGLDAILMGTAFAECTVLLLADGIFQLLDGQTPAALGTRDYSVTYGALKDYGVSTIYCSASDLATRGLVPSDLTVDVTPVDDDRIKALFAEHDVIFSA